MLSEILFWVIIIISSIFTMFWIMIWLMYPDIKSNKARISRYPSVSIAVPAYNEGKHIYSTLESLKNLAYPKSKKEIIVIDDGSTDNTYKEIEKFVNKNPKENIVIIRNKRNIGKAKSLNKALKIAKGEFFVVMDADTVINKNALLSMLSLYHGYKNNKIGGIISHIKVKKSKSLIEKFQRFEYIYAQFMRNLMSRINVLYITPGAFSLYKTKLIKQLGGFCENTLTEDFEMALRLKYHDYEILFDSDAISYTHIPSNLKSYINQRLRWNLGFIDNTEKYFRKFISKKDISLFGHVIYPSSLFSLMILIVYVLKNAYHFLKNLINKIQIYYYTNKIYLFEIDSIREFLITSNYRIIIPLLAVILASLAIYFLAFKHGKERIKEIFVFIIYFLTYTTLTLLIWIFSVLYYYAIYKRKGIKKWLK